MREGVGMIDVSTLGGLDVRGPDAAAFIDRMYTWAYEKQQIGRARYALMTDQTGVVIDDGVAARLHERHFYVTATTGAVDQVYRQMTWFNAQWKMDVDVANVTAAYAGINLAGPQRADGDREARQRHRFLGGGIPLHGGAGRARSPAFRCASCASASSASWATRSIVPSGLGEALWDRLMEAGKPFGIVPFGVEAQRILRLEKGHIIVGQDTDGLTHPAEADMEWALAKKKPFYVGKRAVDMQMAKGVTRKLAGFALARCRRADAEGMPPRHPQRRHRRTRHVRRALADARQGRRSRLPAARPRRARPALRDPRRRRPHGRRRRRWRRRSTIPKTSGRSCDEELEHGRSRSPMRAARRCAAGSKPTARHGAIWATLRSPKAIGDAAPTGGIAIVDLSPLPRLGFKGRGTIRRHAERAASLSRRRPIAPSASRTAACASFWRPAR